jgi:hypothetical protein
VVRGLPLLRPSPVDRLWRVIVLTAVVLGLLIAALHLLGTKFSTHNHELSDAEWAATAETLWVDHPVIDFHVRVRLAPEPEGALLGPLRVYDGDLEPQLIGVFWPPGRPWRGNLVGYAATGKIAESSGAKFKEFRRLDRRSTLERAPPEWQGR